MVILLVLSDRLLLVLGDQIHFHLFGKRSHRLRLLSVRLLLEDQLQLTAGWLESLEWLIGEIPCIHLKSFLGLEQVQSLGTSRPDYFRGRRIGILL